MPAGTSRRVFIPTFGRIVVKVPRLRNFFGGMRANRWEMEMWRIWRPHFGWRRLCPVLFGDPAGLLLVMARAEQPITQTEIDSLKEPYPSITVEYKVEDYGRYADRIVAVDYGLWHADDVAKERANYASFVSEGKSHRNGEEQDDPN